MTVLTYIVYVLFALSNILFLYTGIKGLIK